MLHTLVFQLLLHLVRHRTLLRFAADHVELLRRFFNRCLSSYFRRHTGAVVCRVCWLPLHQKQRVPSRMLGGGFAGQHVVYPLQVVILGKHSQAGDHAFAGVVEVSAMFRIQRLDALTDLLVQGMVGVARLSGTEHSIRRRRRGGLGIRPWLSPRRCLLLGGCNGWDRIVVLRCLGRPLSNRLRGSVLGHRCFGYSLVHRRGWWYRLFL